MALGKGDAMMTVEAHKIETQAWSINEKTPYK